MPSAPEASHAGLAAMERLRRIAERGLSGEPLDATDAEWLATGVKLYEQRVHDGRRFDEVLSLVSGPGQAPWWRAERQRERDRLIRELASGYEGSASARAVRLQGVLRRYQSTSWIRDRTTREPTTANRPLFDIFSLDGDPPTGIWQLSRIIAGSR
jgi:hypothetical protein